MTEFLMPIFGNFDTVVDGVHCAVVYKKDVFSLQIDFEKNENIH